MANWFLSESGIRPIRPLPQAFPEPRAGLSTQSYVRGFLNNPFSCAPALSSRERKCALQVSSRLNVGSVDEVDFDPGAPPPFKLADVRAAIPKHCWVKDPWRSMSFVVRDVGVVFGLAAAAAYLNNRLVWPLYWATQGTMFWALFVLGHDCGHGSFSNNYNLNSVVGHVLHSSILVPYHGWRISHRIHHQNQGHAENDESWHPLSAKIYNHLDGITRTLRFTIPFPLLAYPLILPVE